MAWIQQGILLILSIAVSILLGLAWLGFPGFLTRWILAAANDGAFFITANQVKLDLRGGIDASDVMVYRKGVTGPPFLEMRNIQILFHVFDLRPADASRVKVLRASGGVIRPLWSAGSAATRGGDQGGTSLLPPSVPSVLAGRSATRMDLDVTLADFDALGVWVEGMRTLVQVDREEIRLSRLSGRVGKDMQRGSVEGTLAWKPRHQVTGHFVTSFDPHALTPVCTQIAPEVIPVLEQFSFSAAPPRLDLSVKADLEKPCGGRIDGRMQASQFAYRGNAIGFANISGAYVYGNGTNRLTLDPFLFVVGGRKAEGKCEYDLAARTASFEVISAIDVIAALRLAGLKDHVLESWHSGDGTRIVAKGDLNYKLPERSRVEASVEGTRVGFGPVVARDYALHFLKCGLTNQLSDLRGKFGGGSFSGSALMQPGVSPSNRISRFKTEIIHADADEVMKLLSTNQVWRTAGKLYGNMEWTVVSGDAGSVLSEAQGQLALSKAMIFRLPLLGGLVDRLARLLPGIDVRGTEVEARFSFQLVKGRVKSKEIRIESGPVALVARGSCGLDGTLDYVMEVRILRKLGVLGHAIESLFPSGAIAEVRLGGTIEAPRWSRGGSK